MPTADNQHVLSQSKFYISDLDLLVTSASQVYRAPACQVFHCNSNSSCHGPALLLLPARTFSQHRTFNLAPTKGAWNNSVSTHDTRHAGGAKGGSNRVQISFGGGPSSETSNTVNLIEPKHARVMDRWLRPATAEGAGAGRSVGGAGTWRAGLNEVSTP